MYLNKILTIVLIPTNIDDYNREVINKLIKNGINNMKLLVY